MSVDPAFEGVGQKVGLEIWRIEKLKVVLQDKATYGQFYSGDSYIVLNTKKQRNSPKLEWDLHFWLGRETSQDEKGVAAYKTVELDDSLGGGPVQYREVQDHESKLFLSYFKNGINYLDGGIDSGFKKVERGVYQKRLLHVKGKRNVRVRQARSRFSVFSGNNHKPRKGPILCGQGVVVELTYRSLNQGDVFILDCGLTLYLWNGPNSSKMERIKAAEVARRIKDEERGGKAAVKFIEERWKYDAPFFKALGDNGTIKEEDEAGDDESFEKQAQMATKLFRVTDESGQLEVKEVEAKPLKREHLESEDCFILDSGPSGIYAWIGKKCTKNEKKQAWARATEFLEMRGYADWTPVTQVVEGGETPLFKQYFKAWVDPGAQKGLGNVSRTEKIAQYSNQKFDSTTMYHRKETKQEDLPDDGSGHIQIWRIENSDMVAQAEDTYGIFYTVDCYIILYSYKKGNRDQYIIYFWQGAKSSIDERGASAIYAQRLDDQQLGGAAVQVRVVQGREPEHFLRIFKGKMIVLLGDGNTKDIRVFHVRGTNSFNTRAAQVLPRASSLNSNDVFIIETEKQRIVWTGKGASPDEKDVAMNLLDHISPDRHETEVMAVNEGSENDEFWAILGGEEPYATGVRLENNCNDIPPRLFQCSNASGKFSVEEVVDFGQVDLAEDDVMILDTIDEVYVWLGKGANEIERKLSLQTATDYIEHDPSGRNADNTVILQIKQGFEPPAFTGHFLGWDPDKWSDGKTYEDLKRELGHENVKATTAQEELASYNTKHPYLELVKPVPPKGVDPCFKERYLTDEEFENVFKITYKQFSRLQQWKQIDLKKKFRLF